MLIELNVRSMANHKLFYVKHKRRRGEIRISASHRCDFLSHKCGAELHRCGTELHWRGAEVYIGSGAGFQNQDYPVFSSDSDWIRIVNF